MGMDIETIGLTEAARVHLGCRCKDCGVQGRFDIVWDGRIYRITCNHGCCDSTHADAQAIVEILNDRLAKGHKCRYEIERTLRVA